jgi:hypothetical protein
MFALTKQIQNLIAYADGQYRHSLIIQADVSINNDD